MFPRALARACGLILGLGLLAGCGTHAPPPIASADLRLARQFGLFNFYWVGQTFQGIALTAADSRRDYDAVVGMRAYYGNCGSGSILSTGGCRLPLEIATMVYKAHSDVGFGPDRIQTTIRGVPAEVYHGGKSIELYTGKLSIDIYAQTPELAQAAAAALVPLNRPGLVFGDLPPPRDVPRVDPHSDATERARPLAQVARDPKRG